MKLKRPLLMAPRSILIAEAIRPRQVYIMLTKCSWPLTPDIFRTMGRCISSSTKSVGRAGSLPRCMKTF